MGGIFFPKPSKVFPSRIVLVILPGLINSVPHLGCGHIGEHSYNSSALGIVFAHRWAHGLIGHTNDGDGITIALIAYYITNCQMTLGKFFPPPTPQPAGQDIHVRNTGLLHHAPPPSFHQFFPASVTTSSNFVMITHSNSSFKVPSPPPPTTLWVTPSPSPFLHTPIFFQRLIGPNPPSEESCSAIAEAIVQASLIACSDGSCNSGIGSHGWVFASVRGTIISSGAGPVDGHPSLMSSYRSEASGIAATLCIILKICHHYEITRGLVLCYCDSKGVLNNIYKKCQRGITPFLNTDYDLVPLCHTLLADIPIEIRGEWVKGHHYPRQMEPKYEINHLADANAIKFSSSPAPSFTPRKLPLSYPGFRVQLHCDNSIITSNLYQT